MPWDLWGSLWRPQGLPKSILATIYDVFGRFQNVVNSGRNGHWDFLCVSCVASGLSWWPLGAPLGSQMVPWESLGGPWGSFGIPERSLGPPWCLLWGPFHLCVPFGSLLGTLSPFGSLLVPFWGPFHLISFKRELSYPATIAWGHKSSPMLWWA